MNSSRHVLRTRSSPTLFRVPGTLPSYGRSPPYRRISSLTSSQSFFSSPSSPSSLSSRILLRSAAVPPTRLFHSQSRLAQVEAQQKQPEPEPESDPRPDTEAKAKASPSSSADKDGAKEEAKEEARTDDSGENTDGKKEGEKGGEKEGPKEESQKDGKQKKQEEMPPPPPHGNKTPWQVFRDTMQSEFKASKDWNEGTKAIADSAHQIKESEKVRLAREAYEKTSGAVSSTASTVIKSTATSVAKGAQWTWETPVVKGVRKGANVTGEALDQATKPIRETEAFKSVKETIDDGSSSRYGGWVEKEERRKRRELRDKKFGIINQAMQEDPNAGTNITLHKDAAWKEAWNEFRDNNKFVQSVFGLKSVYNESENPLITTARGITDSITGFFSENETAMVIKKFRAMDPSFKLEPFLEELREYILPEVLDAYVKGDTEVLKLWLSAAQYSVYEALTKQYLQAGLKSDGKILDIRHVDILRARMLEPGDVPVFIITCRTQEVHVYRNAKSGKLAAGMEDKVQLVTYAIGMTRTAEDVNNIETRGWRLIEMQKSGRDCY